MFRLAPIFYYDPSMIQAWLEDYAKRGWFVYEYKNFGASFWQEEPKEVRFRVEPSRTVGERPSVEIQEAYRSMGWSYVCPMDQCYDIWRCDDPEVPELNTDPQVQAAGYDAMRRQNRKGWRVSLAIFLPIAVAVILTTLTGNVYHRYVESWAPWYIDVVRAGILGMFLLMLGYSAWRQRRFLAPLRDGVPQPHRRPYRGAIAMSWAALLLIAAFTVVQVADWLQPDAHSFRLVTEYGEAVPYVEIEGAGEVRAARWENWRTREQWWMTQHPNDYNSRIFVESRYYDFWVKSAAKRMERNLLDSWGGSAEKRTVSDLDAVWHVDDRTYGYLLVRKDSQVFYLACSEKTADLTSYVEHCQEMLLNH